MQRSETAAPVSSEIELTPARRQALKWLREHNGDGLFGKDGVLVAAGERAPFMRSTWNALRSAGLVEFYQKKRVRLVRAEGR